MRLSRGLGALVSGALPSALQFAMAASSSRNAAQPPASTAQPATRPRKCVECGAWARTRYATDAHVPTHIMSQRVCCSHSCLRTYLVAKCGCDVGPDPGVEPRAMRLGPPRPSTGLAVSHDLRMMCTDNTIDVYCDRCAEIVQMRAGDIPEGDVEFKPLCDNCEEITQTLAQETPETIRPIDAEIHEMPPEETPETIPVQEPGEAPRVLDRWGRATSQTLLPWAAHVLPGAVSATQQGLE